MMLDIKSVAELARRLETTPRRLFAVTESASDYYEDLVLIDPAKPEKPRDVVNVTGTLRKLQSRIYERLLVPSHKASFYNHGGIRGRDIKTNASAHVGSVFLITRDVANFYPSIHFTRVYGLFADHFRCSSDVAGICTKLCTYRYHLALGLITSPILADCLMSNVDRRIGAMCCKHGLVYTRFVDDITISGPFPIDSGSFPELVAVILRENGFDLNSQKADGGRFSDGTLISKLLARRHRLDVSGKYFSEVVRQLDSTAMLAKGGDGSGSYQTRSQLWGRIQFITWINPGRRREIMQI